MGHYVVKAQHHCFTQKYKLITPVGGYCDNKRLFVCLCVFVCCCGMVRWQRAETCAKHTPGIQCNVISTKLLTVLHSCTHGGKANGEGTKPITYLNAAKSEHQCEPNFDARKCIFQETQNFSSSFST